MFFLFFSEHNGAHSPSRVHINDFKTWHDLNNLVDYSSRGPFFTRHNGRLGRGLVECMLDRAFGNQLWLSMASSMCVSSLSRLRSNHYPLLREANFCNQLHSSSFKFLTIWTLYDSRESFIMKVWSTDIICCPIFILSTKLHLLKLHLKN